MGNRWYCESKEGIKAAESFVGVGVGVWGVWAMRPTSVIGIAGWLRHTRWHCWVAETYQVALLDG